MFLYCSFLGTSACLDAAGRVNALGVGMDRLSYSVVWIGGMFAAQYISYSIIRRLGFLGTLGLRLGFPSLFCALRALDALVVVDGCA
jgi:hypothetical protein